MNSDEKESFGDMIQRVRPQEEPDCQNCGGTGTVTEYEDGLPNGEFECPKCKGTGKESK